MLITDDSTYRRGSLTRSAQFGAIKTGFFDVAEWTLKSTVAPVPTALSSQLRDGNWIK
jgi:hypothetical protein